MGLSKCEVEFVRVGGRGRSGGRGLDLCGWGVRDGFEVVFGIVVLRGL